jgi:methylenetetrahydrofolate reductase (NADPH)
MNLRPMPPRSPVRVSFEFFPPKTEKMTEQLWRAVERLAPLGPRFVSVTYGAGGSTRERTHDTVTRIQGEAGLACAAHLTCVGAAREEVDEVARRYWQAGIRHIVALRGDAPEGAAGYAPHPGGYENAADLVAGLKKTADFEISVAGYPEIHPDSPSSQADLDNLKRKVDAGADRIITQYFFSAETYLRFLERARAAGIWVPIVPGILPVTNFAQVTRFSAACGTSVPAWLAHLFEGLEDDAETRRAVAVNVAAEQCRDLLANGVDEFHFYTLNRADLTYAICHILGIRPSAGAAVMPAAQLQGVQS